MPQEEQARMRAARRRARSGYLRALPILLWCADGRTPTALAEVLFCSRSSVYRTVRASREGTLGLEPDAQGRLVAPVRTPVLLPTLRRSLLSLLKAPPRAYGWGRTRWRGATLATTLHATRGLVSSAETLRRWLHALGWGWKRAKLVAKDDDPHRVDRLARIRLVDEPLRRWEARVFADELASHLWPTGGDTWMPTGTQVAGMTPGTQEKHDLAGARDLTAGTRRPCGGPRKTHGLFRELLQTLDEACPAPEFRRVSSVVANDQIHQAKAVEPWLAQHPRLTRLLLPTYCPRANPIERAFGDGHDLCTRNHMRKRLRDLGADVEEHLHGNGPWKYKLSEISYEPAVTAAVENMAAEEHSKAAA